MNYIDPQVEASVREALERSMETPIIPEDEDELSNGLSTETISNVTPWFEKVGLWDTNTLIKGGKPELSSQREDEELEDLSDEEVDELLAILEEPEEEEEISDEEVESYLATIGEEEDA
jgi:hypothetical protein